MAKRKPIHLYDKLFGVNYYICYGFSEKEYYDVFSRHVGFGDKSIAFASGRTIGEQGEDSICVFIWTKTKSPAFLAHEAMHATAFVLNDCKDTPLCEATEEVYAYNIQMIMGAVNGKA